MILPQHKHRFDGDSGSDIAAQPIDVVFPNGEKRRVILRLGAPFRKPSSEHVLDWWIRAEIENLDSTDGPLVGCGSLHALSMGFRWMVGRLEVLQKKLQCRYYWPDTIDEFDYRSFFTASQTSGQ